MTKHIIQLPHSTSGEIAAKQNDIVEIRTEGEAMEITVSQAKALLRKLADMMVTPRMGKRDQEEMAKLRTAVRMQEDKIKAYPNSEFWSGTEAGRASHDNPNATAISKPSSSAAIQWVWLPREKSYVFDLAGIEGRVCPWPANPLPSGLVGYKAMFGGKRAAIPFTSLENAQEACLMLAVHVLETALAVIKPKKKYKKEKHGKQHNGIG